MSEGKKTLAFWAAAGVMLGIAALVAWLSRSRWDSSEPTPPKIDCPDPFVDECGVRHFHGDVYDLQNHPTPGAHGRV